MQTTRKPRKFWQSTAEIETALIAAAGVTGGELSYSWLRANGHNALTSAMTRAGISLTDIGERLGIKVTGTKKGHWRKDVAVLAALHTLQARYGCIPDRSVIAHEHGHGLLDALSKGHGGLRRFARKHRLPLKTRLSKFETVVKVWLNELVDDEAFVDNARKGLLAFGINLKNPATGCFLELDRYYHASRVAIEINGSQHYRSGRKRWCNATQVLNTKAKDTVKRTLLKSHGVTLITIPPSCHTKQALYNRLKTHGVLKLRKFGETPDRATPSQPQ